MEPVQEIRMTVTGVVHYVMVVVMFGRWKPRELESGVLIHAPKVNESVPHPQSEYVRIHEERTLILKEKVCDQ